MKNLATTIGEQEVYVEHPLYGGSFAASNGESLPFVLPGERVRSHPLEILEPSPNRVTPGCAHFGVCGGCHYQHAAYPTQLELKRTILSDLLSAAGLTKLPPIQTESGPEWRYRNRIRLRIEPDVSGTLHAGYSRRASNDLLPIHECPIATPILWHAAETMLKLAKTDPLVHSWLALTAELELLCAPNESSLQLQLFLRAPDAARRHASTFTKLCETLALALPQLSGAGAVLDPELSRRARRLWPGTTWGASGVNYPAAGRTYWLPRGAFFQVNRFLVDQLVAAVTQGKSGSLAWDLYAGVGLFTRALAESFARVVAVEGAEAAAASLHSAARSQKTIEAAHSSTLDFLRARELQRERPSLIVLDPPRAGISPEAAQILNRLAAAANHLQLVYVSCDPTTLVRDLAILARAYTIDSIHLIDLFPQTFHLETIVHLSKRAVP